MVSTGWSAQANATTPQPTGGDPDFPDTLTVDATARILVAIQVVARPSDIPARPAPCLQWDEVSP